MDSSFKRPTKAQQPINIARVLAPFVFFGLLLVLEQSCIPDPLTVNNVPDVKPQIVVNTFFVPDDSLVVFLTKTFGALEASDNSDVQEVLDLVTVNDALVTIEGPSSTDTLLALGNGLYGIVGFQVEEDRQYRLNIDSESLGEVHGITTAQARVPFDSVVVERYFNGFDDTLAQVTYTIQDPVERNYYMINVQRFSLEDPIEERVLNPTGFTKLLEDNADGREISGTFRAFPRDYEKGDTVVVLLSNISEDYYNFIQLRLDNRFSFVEFVSEPVNYPSNIVGGKGFFNLYIPDIRIFVLED